MASSDLPRMAIARFPSFVIDCRDAAELATFYGALLDWKVESSSGWAEVRSEDGQCICFQGGRHVVPRVLGPRRTPVLPLRLVTRGSRAAGSLIR